MSVQAADMGYHIMLDFSNIDIQKFNLIEKPEQLVGIIDEGLKLTDCKVCDKKYHIFPQKGGMTIMYLLSESHISLHTFPSQGCITIDFYNCGAKCQQNLKQMEEFLCSVFGWENCIASIILPRGKGYRNLRVSENEAVSIMTKQKQIINKQPELKENNRIKELNDSLLGEIL